MTDNIVDVDVDEVPSEAPSSVKFKYECTGLPEFSMRNFCSMFENQELVDVTLVCGDGSIQAHKLVLAANSLYFMEEFTRNPSAEQIFVKNCSFLVLKNVLELMYFGKTQVLETNIKFVSALIRSFELDHLKLFCGLPQESSEHIEMPKPEFCLTTPESEYGEQNLNWSPNRIIEQEPDPEPDLMSQIDKTCQREAEASKSVLARLKQKMNPNQTAVNNLNYTISQAAYQKMLEESIENVMFLPLENECNNQDVPSTSFSNIKVIDPSSPPPLVYNNNEMRNATHSTHEENKVIKVGDTIDFSKIEKIQSIPFTLISENGEVTLITNPISSDSTMPVLHAASEFQFSPEIVFENVPENQNDEDLENVGSSVPK